MPTVVGVKLRFAGRILWFDPAGSEPEEGQHVIVSTERGEEYGEVITASREVDASELHAPLKPVIRVSTPEDDERVAAARASERSEIETFRRLVNKYKLDMKPIGVEHLFDGSKMVFYFAADERVDFRDLVRDLASEFHTRIDMRQVGVRDEARMIGGLGHCGQQLCCVRFGGEFQPVSIRMAKEQDLPLNPLKISGLCGRLMCCLRYEYDAYKDFKQRAPKVGTPVEMPTGDAKIVALNVPRETVTIRPQGGGEQITVPLTSLDCSAGRGCPCVLSAEAMPVRGSVADMAHGTTPILREAERSATEEPVQRQGRSRKKGSAPKVAGEQQGGSQRSDGQSRQRSGKGGGQKDKAPQVQQQTQAGSQEPKPAGSSGRRRRRRRPRSNGTDAPQE